MTYMNVVRDAAKDFDSQWLKIRFRYRTHIAPTNTRIRNPDNHIVRILNLRHRSLSKSGLPCSAEHTRRILH